MPEPPMVYANLKTRYPNLDESFRQVADHIHDDGLSAAAAVKDVRRWVRDNIEMQDRGALLLKLETFAKLVERRRDDQACKQLTL